MKALLLSVSFFYSISLVACSCFATYQTLADKICNTDSYSGSTFEMRLNRTNDEGAFFTVERILAGEITQEEIFVFAGDNGNCGLPVNEYAINSRYLFFAGPETDSTGTDYSFECGPARNIYELSSNSTQIRYMTPGVDTNSFPGPLEWQSYPGLLINAPCDFVSSLTPTENPLKTVGLAANPGGGVIQLYAAEDSFPGIEKVQVFDISGRLVFTSRFDALTPTQPYDLSRLPVGVYAVVVSNQQWRRGMKYVKVR